MANKLGAAGRRFKLNRKTKPAANGQLKSTPTNATGSGQIHPTARA